MMWIVAGIVFLLLGLAVLKAENKDTGAEREKSIAQQKMVGIFIIICSVALIVTGIFLGGNGNTSSSPNKDSFGHTQSAAFVIAQDTVNQQLKSPSSAKYCSMKEANISRSGNTWTVSGWVDADNSFGASIRNKFTVTITFSSKDKYTVDSCSIS